MSTLGLYGKIWISSAAIQGAFHDSMKKKILHYFKEDKDKPLRTEIQN